MFRADSILFMLAGVLGLWGLSLVVRGAWGDRSGGRRRCPACERDVAAGANRCAACGYESTRGRDFRAAVRHWGEVFAGVVVVLLASGVYMGGIGVRRWAYTGGDYGFVRDAGPWAMLTLGVIAFGLALMARGLFGRSPGGKRRCPKCWYDMEGLPGMVCPECGHDTKLVRDLYRRRRRSGVAAAGAVICLVGLGALSIPVVKRGGWVGLVPSFVLIGGFEQLPDSLVGGNSSNDDRSLWHRFAQETLAGWEKRWLRNKCMEILRTSDDPALLRRALCYVWRDTEAGYVYLPRITADLESSDLERRSGAARRVPREVAWFPFQVPEGRPAPLRGHGEALGRLAHDESSAVAAAAATLLAYCDEDPSAIAADLLTLVAQGAGQVSANAAPSLTELVRRHEPARAVVTAALGSNDSRTRMSAFLALRTRPYLSIINDQLGAPEFGEILADHQKNISKIWDLHNELNLESDPSHWDPHVDQELEDAYRAALPTLRRDLLEPRLDDIVRALECDEFDVRRDAAYLLGWACSLCPIDHAPALIALRAHLDDPEIVVREAAARAISVLETAEH